MDSDSESRYSSSEENYEVRSNDRFKAMVPDERIDMVEQVDHEFRVKLATDLLRSGILCVFYLHR
jgi:hypothetical protein